MQVKILPNGDLYEVIPSYTHHSLNGVLIARLVPSYYNAPSTLINASNVTVPVTLSV